MAEPSAAGLVELFPDSAEAGARLARRGWRLAFAESCTGGLLGAALTAVPGSSRYVVGGVVAYANEVKIQVLGVPAEAIVARGAVSDEVAGHMARGVRRLLRTEVGVGITGVAGPGAEEGGKPAGLAFVAVSSPQMEKVVRLDGDHGRESNRAACVRSALALLLELG